jgi:protein phosphatase
MSDPSTLPHAAATDVGRRRDHNEDAVHLQPPLLVVADGVGGSAKGEVASRLAIDTFVAAAADALVARSTDDAVRAMERAVLAANTAVHDSQLADETRRGMATTITAAVVRDGGEVVIGHVGDSRLYVLNEAGARQVTDDHSVVAELVRTGRLAPEDVATHPQRNVITRALGPEGDVSVDAFAAHVGPGDWLLACSDGLTEHVTDDEVARVVVGSGRDPQAAVQRLVDLANERGGTDNITVAVMQPVPSDVSGELSVQAIDAAIVDSSTTTPMPVVDAPAEASGPLPVLEPMEQRDEPPAGERSMLRVWVIAIAVVVLAVVVTGFVWSSSYFLLVRGDGTVGIDRGFPFAGLSTEHRTTDLEADTLDPAERERLVDSHRLLERDEAEQVLEDLPRPLDTSHPDDEDE